MTTGQKIVYLCLRAAIDSTARRMGHASATDADPATNLVMMAYNDGVTRMAEAVLSVVDGTRSADEAFDGIRDFADRIVETLGDGADD